MAKVSAMVTIDLNEVKYRLNEVGTEMISLSQRLTMNTDQRLDARQASMVRSVFVGEIQELTEYMQVALILGRSIEHETARLANIEQFFGDLLKR